MYPDPERDITNGKIKGCFPFFSLLFELEDNDPLRGPTSTSCGGPLAEGFFALRAKKNLITLFWPIIGHFWCPVVTLLTLSSNLKDRHNKKS